MTEAASNALLFEQEIDERVVMALMRVLTDRADVCGFRQNLMYAVMQQPEVQRHIEERCASYMSNMQQYWMHEGAKKYAGSMHAPMAKWSNF